ncbi:hypothetical protein AWL63_06180 [Sphingomonas panacis]|uniref:Phage tail protein I n=1 Tax=Sphingomonas panacis TaxID=1560345 RepID=A0A1B3Z889_9SPHN|nr:phage tail protein I [Sphingomonas panacis]AOH83619.1 hypothetical protein AWL63_06180 [Sphingomonas panacis]
MSAPDLLPPNATPLERAIASASARIEDVPIDLAALWNPATCPSDLLPWLAWALSTDNWDTGWSDAQRRAAVASAIEDQRHKGTRYTVERVLASFDELLRLVEWFEMSPRGAPYTFEVRLPVIGADGVAGGQRVSAQFARTIYDAVSAAKPVRAHFQLVQQLAHIARPGLVAALQATSYRRIDADTRHPDDGTIWTDLLQTEYGEPLADDFGTFIDGTA